MAAPVLLLVRNIPTSLKSRDLRVIFRDAVDGNIFAGAGCCFHYKHRPESALPAAVAPLSPSPSPSPSSPSSSPPSQCCIIRVIDAEEAAHFRKEYHGVPWYNKEGEELPRGSGTIQIKIVGIKTEDGDAVAALPELNPPSGLPQGNIGTTHATILEMINACKLPPSVLKSLAIKFRVQRKRKYSSVAPPVSHEHSSNKNANGGGNIEVKKRKGVAAHWHRRDRCVLVSDAAAAAAAAASDEGPVGGGRATGVEREDHDAEEWDRHISLNGEPGAAGKERLFEEDVSQPWEKGGSGLVFRTDASFWNQTENDFDEKTTDDVDVDIAGYYEEGAGDQGFKDLRDLRRTGVHRPHPGLRGRHHVEDVVEDRKRAAAEFEQYTRGVGSRILGAHGWKKGEGLGRPATRQTAIISPLSAEGQSQSKRGLGYKGPR